MNSIEMISFVNSSDDQYNAETVGIKVSVQREHNIQNPNHVTSFFSLQHII